MADISQIFGNSPLAGMLTKSSQRGSFNDDMPQSVSTPLGMSTAKGVAGGGGGGGGGVQDGLGQIYSGANTVSGAVNAATQALSGGGGNQPTPGLLLKKGGYVDKKGKINLGSGRVSTAVKNKASKNW